MTWLLQNSAADEEAEGAPVGRSVKCLQIVKKQMRSMLALVEHVSPAAEQGSAAGAEPPVSTDSELRSDFEPLLAQWQAKCDASSARVAELEAQLAVSRDGRGNGDAEQLLPEATCCTSSAAAMGGSKEAMSGSKAAQHMQVI
jgi:hypothetical protein